MKGKTSFLSGSGHRALVFMSIFAILALLLFSCAQMGSTMQGVAALGQQLGFLNEEQANILQKSGVAADAWGKAFEDITPEQEYYIGRSVGANILARYSLQPSRQELAAYVNKVCNALIINSARPEIFNGYHANILDTDEINAFATPGGHIFLTRGLVNSATSEDTLAAVIAHEIAHIQLQHGLKSIKNSRRTQAVLLSVDAGASAASGDISEAVGSFSESINDMVTTMVTNGYSRTQEYEADSVAMSLLALAGYQPSSLLDMLKLLETTQKQHPGGFNNTHPTPAQRIENANKTVKNYSVEDTRSYREARFKAVN